MTGICDLHTHSVFSDGTYTPAEIVEEALRIGLSAVALCDHNTVEGLPDFLSAAAGKDIEAIAGAEFSVDWEGTELHLLGLYLPTQCFPEINALMQSVHQRKEMSNIALVESLKKAGYALDYEAIKRTTPSGKINRAHIATELMRGGYVASRTEAFDTLLSPSAGHYREPERLTVWKMIDVIRSVGAVPVLAHPLLELKREKLNSFLPAAKKAGLLGMECYYSLYDHATTEASLQLAATYGLAPSGGSDFHGMTKPNIGLGIGTGQLSVPYQWAVDLKP